MEKKESLHDTIIVECEKIDIVPLSPSLFGLTVGKSSYDEVNNSLKSICKSIDKYAGYGNDAEYMCEISKDTYGIDWNKLRIVV